MKARTVLRLISLTMLIIAIIFAVCALSNPGLGMTFYIGNIRIGVEVWHTFYSIYAIAMIGMFVSSFFIKSSK